jgi:hypothetical protein
MRESFAQQLAKSSQERERVAEIMRGPVTAHPQPARSNKCQCGNERKATKELCGRCERRAGK